MSTHGFVSSSAAIRSRRRIAALARRADPPRLLGLGLAAAVLYAAFAHGAAGSPAEPRLQVGVALIAALGCAVWSWGGSLRAQAPWPAWAGLGLLAAFTVWSGVSLLWSVAPDGTWVEVNRYLTYTVVLFLAVVFAASTQRPLELAAQGFIVLALLVAVYALGQKLLPWIHVPGLIDLDQTGATARLQQPFGYWNALALFLVMALPLLLALCTDRTRAPRVRIGAVVALELMYVTIGYTYSRGAIVAVLAGLVVALALSRSRLRGLLWLAVAAVGAVIPLLLGLLNPSLNGDNVALSSRALAGAILLVVLAASVFGLVRLARRVIAREATVHLSRAQAHRIARLLVAAVGAVIVIAVIGIGLSHRGLSGTITHTWHDFTAGKGLNDTNPTNLVSADSGNRWVWWKEAAGAFSARPLDGWGAGSFPVVHLLYRTNSLGTRSPHSVPLQYLAETGLIGAVLAIGAFLLLLGAGLRTVRSRRSERDRLLAAALLGAAVAYGVHACFDWDADIPGVTLPALVFLGALAGAGRARITAPRLDRGRLPTTLDGGAAQERSSVVRLVASVLLAAGMCVYACSAALPAIAAGDASSANVAAAAPGSGTMRQAEQQAVLANRLDPLSDAGFKVLASIALGRGDYPGARAELVRALRRQPSDAQAWATLAFTDALAHDPTAAQAAIRRVLELDPEGRENLLFAADAAATATIELAPPQDSATGAPTPQQAQYGAVNVSPAVGAAAP